MNYKGEKCTACGIVFNDDDDVVVCPECGSPHHRACYMETKTCANIELHAENKKWTRLEEENDIAPDPEVIPTPIEHSDSMGQPIGAGADGENGAKYFDGTPESLLNFFGFDPKEDMGGASLKEVSIFVGPNTFYYIPKFKKMKDLGSKISFNISCLLFSPLYFANRRMWGWSIITAILMVLLGIPDMLLIIEDNLISSNVAGYEAVLTMISDNKTIINELSQYTGIVSWIMGIVLCLFGNRIYYSHVLRSVKKIKASSDGTADKELKLMTAGGVKPINVLFIMLIMSGISLASLYVVFSAMA